MEANMDRDKAVLIIADFQCKSRYGDDLDSVDPDVKATEVKTADELVDLLAKAKLVNFE